MKRRSRAGSVKSRRRNSAAPKRPSRTEAARPRSSSAASQESEAARLASELSAMSEILRLISNSSSNIETVLRSVAEQAAHICQAQFVDIFLVENDDLRDVAWFGELKRTLVFPLDRSTVSGRSVCEMRPVSIDDLQNAGDDFARGREIARRDGHRSILAVPLIRESRAVGTINIRRTEIRPFEQKHIALLTNFAAQAVIAIENARLLNELRQRTTDLTESLEQQTATSEVLKAISGSLGDLAPVFESLLANAKRLCGAKFGTLLLREGAALRTVAIHGATAEYTEARRRAPVIEPAPDTGLGRVLKTKQVVQIDDIQKVPGYLANPVQAPIVQLAGARSILSVPMLKEKELVGIVEIYRQEVQPFTEKQIALLQNFAAQAVIAIENARLLNELRQRTVDLKESLEQQTATAEVLKVISTSTGELQPVFRAILENAVQLCGAKFGTLYLRDGTGFRAAAMQNVPPAYAKQRAGVVHPSPAMDRMVQSRKPVHVADLRTDRSYLDGHPLLVTAVDAGGIRTYLGVPMLKADELVGVISIYRTEVRPFTGKQIELLTNFAAQAVIAIENARLLNELRESYRLVQQQAGKLEAQSQELVKLNQQLEQRVVEQVGEIERMSRLRRFLPPQVADLIVASGTEKQLESHRREITALFCDLRGFTGFSESSDPEDVIALLREYHAAIGQIIVKYNGTLERFAGDGVMVVFNDPVPVPNPALQAVQMALDMRVAIGALIEKWQRLGHDLGFGIGIAHGFATLGTIGFEGRFDYAAIGTVSNVASRLCDEAKPGQILISPRVLMAVENAVTVEPVGEFALKGIRRPMSAYNVLGCVQVEKLN
jgi:GAF domain-containing protein